LRPKRVCYCAFITPLENRNRVLILRHPRERDVGIGTARMAFLSLKNASLHTDVDFSQDPLVCETIAAGNAYVLFPDAKAIPVETATFPHPITLIVLDGTWWQAEKLLRANPALRALPKLCMTPHAPSFYGQVRAEPAEDFVGTIEAIAHVLGYLEGDRERFQTMLRPLRVMVEQQLYFAKVIAEGRHRLPMGRPRKRPGAPEFLRQRHADLVCIHGEANAWSQKHPEHRAPEIVHWLAERVATGERFEAVMMPRGSLSPSTPSHIRLAAEILHAGETFAAFLNRWRAFIRPTDLLLSWGHFALATLAGEGVNDLPPHVDVRPIANNLLARRTGTVEDCATRMPLVPHPIWGQGRGGTRLAHLRGIVETFFVPSGG
jgi:DTW domain-containing protein YfiP